MTGLAHERTSAGSASSTPICSNNRTRSSGVCSPGRTAITLLVGPAERPPGDPLGEIDPDSESDLLGPVERDRNDTAPS